MKYLCSIVLLALLTACTTINTAKQIVEVNRYDAWGIAPFTNNTEVLQAGNRAMIMSSGVLRAKGVQAILAYQPAGNCAQLVVCANSGTSVADLIHWARNNNLHYLMYSLYKFLHI